MKFTILTEITVKNDQLSHDAGKSELAAMLIDRLAQSTMKLPWVIAAEHTLVD